MILDHEPARFAYLAEGETLPVKVLEPCDCAACSQTDPRLFRWFNCRHIASRMIATYDCETAAHLDYVEAAHPGKVYLY